MGIFLVRSSLSPFDENPSDSLLLSAKQAFHIQSQSDHDYFLANHKLAVFHWATDNYFYSTKEQIHVTQSEGRTLSVTILQGYCWSSTGSGSTGKMLTAFDVQQLLSRMHFDVERVRDVLAGEYAIIQASDDGTVIAFNDRLSIEHIYYSKKGNISSLTNRIAVLPYIEDQSDYHLEAMLALPSVGYMIGEDTYIKGVTRLAQGATIQLRNGELKVQDHKDWIYQNAPRKDEVRDLAVFDTVVDHGVNECLANVKAIFSRAEQIPLALTGGKDSRLILALALQAGLRDKLRLFTNGIEEHPDVIVAKQLAEHVHLPHATNKPGKFNDPTVATQELLGRLATHVFQNDGMFGAWDIKAGKQCAKSLTLAGFIGEAFKGYLKKPFHYATMPNPAQMIAAHGPFDPLAILREEARSAMAAKILNRMENYLGPGAEFNDIPDLYYVKERIPNWLGSARRKDADSVQVVMPINSTGLIRLAFALTALQRQHELIHFAMLRRLEPSLLEIPFAQQTWHRGLMNYGAPKSVFQDAILAPSGLPQHGSWQYTINKNPQFRAALLGIFSDYPESPLWQFIDRKKVLEVMKTVKFNMAQMISVFGLVTIFFKIHNIEIPQKALVARSPGFTPEDHVVMQERQSGLFFRFDQDKKNELLAEKPSGRKPLLVAREAMTLLSRGSKLRELSLEGRVNSENGEVILGWARCLDFPFMNLTLEVLENGQVIDRVVAGQFRGDLKKAGKGSGEHAFRYERKGKPVESLTFRVMDTSFELQRSGLASQPHPQDHESQQPQIKRSQEGEPP